jgi:methylglyoxal synthase
MSQVVDIASDRQETPVLALIAHDALKDDLLRLVRAHRSMLSGFRLAATRTSGRVLAEELGIEVELVGSGPLGGDLQIAARIVDGLIDAVIFLRDPLTSHPHEPDIQALLKVCDVHRVPVATNLASAEILLHFLAGHVRAVEFLAGHVRSSEEVQMESSR